MKKKTMVGLCLCYLVTFTVGNGFLPLMPLYARMRGATSEVAGFYVALATLCVAAGVLLGGRLSDLSRQRRPLLAAAGAATVPMAWLIGRAENVWQLALANGAQWLAGGMCIGIVGAIVGSQADDAQRGRVFGILGVTISLGSLLGGLTFGRMVDSWGYPGMSTIAALISAIAPASALLLVSEGNVRVAGKGEERPKGRSWMSGALLLLLLAEVLAMVAAGVGNMGRSFSMDQKSFSNGAITTTMAIGGLVSLPFPFMMGWLSDMLGRRKIMIASFLAGTAGLVLLIFSRSLWQFWAMAALMSVHSVSLTLGPAYVADITRKERVGTGIALLQSSAWIGMILGYIYSGIVFQGIGMTAGLAFASGFPILGVLVLFFVKAQARSRERPEREPAAPRLVQAGPV